MVRAKSSQYRPLDEDDVSPEQQRLLLTSPEAMDERKARDLGKLAVFPHRKLQGRRRVAERNPGSFDFKLSPTIPAEQIVKLGKALGGKQPVLGKFNRANALRDVSMEGLEKFVHGGSNRNERRPIDPNNEREKRIIRNNRRRQPEKLRTYFQRDTFEKYKTAQLSRASLDLVRKQLRRGLELDAVAVVWATQAIIDFGASLDEGEQGKEILRGVRDESLGMKIRHVGELASEDTSVLGQNPELLRLVQLEQASREAFWGERYQLSTEVIDRDRLTVPHHENGNAITQEVTRMRQLGAAVVQHA